MIPGLRLASGDLMPMVGLGTWKLAKERAAELIAGAVEAGYRHFDCACDYGNEPQIGAGLSAAMQRGLCRREDMWITSKLWNTYHARERVRTACERTLR